MDSSKRRELATAEAADWWLRMQAGELSLAERKEYFDWLRESVIHVAEMVRISQVHGALEQFEGWDQVSTEGCDEPSRVASFPETVRVGRQQPPVADFDETPRRPARHWWLAGAAAASMAAFAVWWFIAAQTQLIETGRGERRGLTLADGSVVHIDPESRLRIRYDDHLRKITLERGRLLFRVARDAARPFVVHAGTTQVRAVGTQFGVEHDRDGIVVTVAEGKVMVQPQETSSPFGSGKTASLPSESPASETANGDAAGTAASRGNARQAAASANVLLTAGEQVTVPEVGPARAVRRVDSERELAWAVGRLVFDQEPVADVVEKFNRYNIVQLHVADTQLARRTVSGAFDASAPESFIRFMQSVVPVRVSRTEQDITISSVP